MRVNNTNQQCFHFEKLNIRGQRVIEKILATISATDFGQAAKLSKRKFENGLIENSKSFRVKLFSSKDEVIHATFFLFYFRFRGFSRRYSVVYYSKLIKRSNLDHLKQ